MCFIAIGELQINAMKDNQKQTKAGMLDSTVQWNTKN